MSARLWRLLALAGVVGMLGCGGDEDVLGGDDDDAADDDATSGDDDVGDDDDSTEPGGVCGDEPWPGPNKYPGDRRLDGTIPPPAEEPWGDPRTNVWQGLPAAEPDPAYFSDLTGEIVEVCEDGDDSGVIAYVNNHGYLATDLDCGVAVYSLADGSLLGSGVMPAGLPSGAGRVVEIVVPTSAVAGGLELVVDEANEIAECDDANNTAVWPAP